MEGYTIAEEFTLPSEGKIYSSDKKVNPCIKLKSMTTEQEMKRLAHSPYVYKMFSDIIDECLVEKPGISTYDLAIGDYQFLLYKLRTVTYGPDYAIQTMCPYCGKVNKMTVNLDELKINRYSKSLDSLMEFELPVTKKLIKLKLQTPRILDSIEKQTKALAERSSDSIEPAVLFNTMSLIDTVDGNTYDEVKLETFVRKLPMRDTNAIINKAKKLIQSIGIDTQVSHVCEGCKETYSFSLPITGEFFGPTED